MKQKIENCFKSIVGQVAHKLALLNMILANLVSEESIPALILYGERGSGKTTLMRAIIKALEAEIVLPVNDGETLPTPNALRGENGDQSAWRSFEENLLVALSSDKRVVITLDEFHELGKGPKYTPLVFQRLANILMTICILSKEGKVGTVKLGESFAIWNPAKHFIVLGSNYPEKINPAMASRLRDFSLAAYTQEQLAEILAFKLTAKGFHAAEDTIRPMVNLCRTSAREVDSLISEIAAVIGAQGKKTINKADIKTAMLQMQKFPFGFCADMVATLETLDGVTYTTPLLASLKPSLAGIIGNEMAIAWNAKLVSRSSKGWSLTEKGKGALKDWRKSGFKW